VVLDSVNNGGGSFRAMILFIYLSSPSPGLTNVLIFECRLGVVFCGRQSPGGHNIITGLFDAVKKHNSESTLIGFTGE
jgi:hypothetical protein